MFSAPYRPFASPDDRLRGRRLGSLALAIAIHLLLLLLLLRQAIHPEMPAEKEGGLTVFNVGAAPAPQQKAERKQESQPQKADDASKEPTRPKPIKPIVTPNAPKTSMPFIELSSADMASADIAGMAKSSGQSSGATGDSKASYGPGEGPGGVQLYEADWYRRPTDAELAGYLPANAPPDGWGLVACKTVDHYHVENCQALGESPLGSGFARAVRQAAWQFLVIPPRINGKPQVGEWVRIRIDYTRRSVAP